MRGLIATRRGALRLGTGPTIATICAKCPKLGLPNCGRQNHANQVLEQQRLGRPADRLARSFTLQRSRRPRFQGRHRSLSGRSQAARRSRLRSAVHLLRAEGWRRLGHVSARRRSVHHWQVRRRGGSGKRGQQVGPREASPPQALNKRCNVRPSRLWRAIDVASAYRAHLPFPQSI